MTLHALIASSSPSKFFGFKSREDGNPGFQGLPEIDYTTPEGVNLPSANAIAISGDSQWLVVGSTTTSTTLLPYKVMLFRRRGDIYKFVTSINPGTLTDVTINYNGTIIGVSGGSSSTYRIIRRNGLTLEPILTSRATASNVYVAPNGKWYGIMQGSSHTIRKIDDSGTMPETVLPGATTLAVNGGMAFSPDSRYVAIRNNSDSKTRIYELFEGTSVLVAELEVSATHIYQWYHWNEAGLWVTGFTAAGTSTTSAILSKLSFENGVLSLVAQGEFDMTSSLWLRTNFLVSHDGSFCIAPMRSNPCARYYALVDQGNGVLKITRNEALDPYVQFSPQPPAIALSQPIIEARASIYPEGLKAIMLGNMPLSSLYVALLDTAPNVFTPAALTLTEAVSMGGGALASSADWPANGVALTSVGYADSNGFVYLGADDVQANFIQEPFTFSTAIIYGTAGGEQVPLIHYDFGSDYTVELGEQLAIQFPVLGLFNIET